MIGDENLVFAININESSVLSSQLGMLPRIDDVDGVGAISYMTDGGFELGEWEGIRGITLKVSRLCGVVIVRIIERRSPDDGHLIYAIISPGVILGVAPSSITGT